MTRNVVRLIAAAPSRLLLERFFHRVKPEAEMSRRIDERTAVFTLPVNRTMRFTGHADDLGIVVSEPPDPSIPD